MSTTPSPETKAKLRKLAADILDSPEQFDMAHWVVVDTPCGTVGCLAGTVCLQAGYLPVPKDHTLEDTFGTPSQHVRRHGKKAKAVQYLRRPGEGKSREAQTLGAELLGLDQRQSDQLFLPSHWPDSFATAYANAVEAGDWRDAACVTGKRLRHFCDTGE